MTKRDDLKRDPWLHLFAALSKKNFSDFERQKSVKQTAPLQIRETPSASQRAMQRWLYEDLSGGKDANNNPPPLSLLNLQIKFENTFSTIFNLPKASSSKIPWHKLEPQKESLPEYVNRFQRLVQTSFGPCSSKADPAILLPFLDIPPSYSSQLNITLANCQNLNSLAKCIYNLKEQFENEKQKALLEKIKTDHL